MIPRDKLPKDAADWSSVQVSLNRLDPDTAEGCPDYPDKVHWVLRSESADVDKADVKRLKFLRTARVGGDKFWAWEYTNSYGDKNYVTCQVKGDGSMVIMGLSEANGLTVEQSFWRNFTMKFIGDVCSHNAGNSTPPTAASYTPLLHVGITASGTVLHGIHDE